LGYELKGGNRRIRDEREERNRRFKEKQKKKVDLRSDEVVDDNKTKVRKSCQPLT
jgi:hypothetical protein